MIRIIVLAAPGLAIVTPPSYRALLMAPHVPAAAVDAGSTPDAAVSGDAGAPGAIDWASMLCASAPRRG